jgi:hypothetical protein
MKKFARFLTGNYRLISRIIVTTQYGLISGTKLYKRKSFFHDTLNIFRIKS